MPPLTGLPEMRWYLKAPALGFARATLIFAESMASASLGQRSASLGQRSASLGRRVRPPSEVEVLLICDVTGPRAKSRGDRPWKQASPPAPLQKGEESRADEAYMAPLPQAKCRAATVLFPS
jgi:hypothetical protein